MIHKDKVLHTFSSVKHPSEERLGDTALELTVKIKHYISRWYLALYSVVDWA